MENQLQVFTHGAFGQVRTLQKDGEVWFVAKDVADALGFGLTADMTRQLDDDEKLTCKLYMSGQNRNAQLINESGLYSAILRSRKPEAKQFKKWVTAEVLPSIRKHGAYMTEDTLEKALTSPDFLIQLATQLKQEQEARRLAEEQKALAEAKVVELQPKAEKYDLVVDASKLLTFEAVAHMTKEYLLDKYGLEANLNKNTFPKLLRELGILTKDRKYGAGYKNLPRKDYQEFFEVKITEYGHITRIKPDKVVDLMEIVCNQLAQKYQVLF
jgi:anti-repressor protein